MIGQLNQKLGVFAKFLVVLLALPLCSGAAAQGMYKCKDAAGRITYSGNECRLIGLTSAGEVTGRASVAPALKFQPPPAAPPAARPAAPAEQGAAAGQASPGAPEKRCFTVKTAKGTATRCNDVPEEAGSK